MDDGLQKAGFLDHGVSIGLRFLFFDGFGAGPCVFVRKLCNKSHQFLQAK
jgi:hypothetical protein